MLKKLFVKYKDIISYLFFGVCTTVVNIVAYWLCAHVAHLSTIVSTSIAWVLAVAFAYITNRLWVFHSKAKGKKAIFREICSFTACRLLTGFLDIAIMYIFVDRLHCPDLIIKIISNIIVIIVNYVASKLVIFNEKENSSIYKKSLVFAALCTIALSLAMLSDWGPWRHRDGFCDTNVYKYVGQTIREGGMPYRDVFDHKGPLLYVMQAAAGAVNEYRGEWILEVGAITISVFAIYCFARRLKCKPVQAFLATIAVLTPFYVFYTTNDGGHVGGCCCLYAMPLVTISLNIFLKYFQTSRIKNLMVWLCGVLCGAALMIRPNLAAVWVAFGIVILVKCIKEKKIRDLVRFIILFILGVLTVIIPLVIWLAANGALADCIEQFIEYNLVYSGERGGIAAKVDVFFYLFAQPVLIFSVIYMIFRLLTTRTKLDVYFGIFFALNTLTAIMSGFPFPHYGIIAVYGIIYPCAMICTHLPEHTKKNGRWHYTKDDALVLVLFLIAIIGAIFPTWSMIIRKDLDTYLGRKEDYNKNSIATVAMANTIQNYTDEDDEIAVYNGNSIIPHVFLHSNRRSATRFIFFTQTIENFKGMGDEYFNTLEAKKPKIVVAGGKALFYSERMRDYLTNNGYRIVYPQKEVGKTLKENEYNFEYEYIYYRPADK